MKLYTRRKSIGGRVTYDEYPMDEISSSSCSRCDYHIEGKEKLGVCDKHAVLVRPCWHCLDFEPILEDDE